MTGRKDILMPSRERGFTLIESVIVIGLTTLIAVGIVAGLLEGLDTLHTVTDTQGVEFQHQRAMTRFVEDVQAATWFYSGTYAEEEGEGEISRPTVSPSELIIGYPGPNDDEVWIRYSTKAGPRTEELYLLRTVVTESNLNQGSTILSTGVSNLEFDYRDAENEFTDQIAEVRRVIMALTVNIGGTTIRREYDVTVRGINHGVREPPGDFEEVEDEYFRK